MSSSSTRLPTADGRGSVSQAPNLPEGFTDMFTSRYVDTGELRLHAVIGGDGPPLLLVHGWPQTWYQFRLVMPALARDFEVIAVEEGERVCVRASQQHVRETQDIAKRPRLVSRACSPKPGCDIGRRGFRFVRPTNALWTAR